VRLAGAAGTVGTKSSVIASAELPKATITDPSLSTTSECR